MGTWIARLESMSAELRADTNLYYDPPFTTFRKGILNGGTAKNSSAGECRFTLEWRPVPGQLPSVLIDVLHNAIVEEKKADLDFDCEVKVTRLDGGFQTNVESELIRFMKSATGNDCGTIAFGTEAPQMIELGAEAVVFGPGNIRVAHQTGEFVPVDELKVCVDVLTSAITNFCC